MRREHFAPYAEGGERYPHGDDDAMVLLVPDPTRSRHALRSDLRIERPGLVPEDSPLVRIDRVYRIATLTADRFELALVREDRTERRRE